MGLVGSAARSTAAARVRSAIVSPRALTAESTSTIASGLMPPATAALVAGSAARAAGAPSAAALRRGRRRRRRRRGRRRRRRGRRRRVGRQARARGWMMRRAARPCRRRRRRACRRARESTERLTLSSALTRSLSLAVGWYVASGGAHSSANQAQRLPRALGRLSGGPMVVQKLAISSDRTTKPSSRPATPSMLRAGRGVVERDAEVLALVAEELLRGGRDRVPVDLAAGHRGQLLDLGFHLLEPLVVRDVRTGAATDGGEHALELGLDFVDDVFDRHGGERIAARPRRLPAASAPNGRHRSGEAAGAGIRGVWGEPSGPPIVQPKPSRKLASDRSVRPTSASRWGPSARRAVCSSLQGAPQRSATWSALPVGAMSSR